MTSLKLTNVGYIPGFFINLFSVTKELTVVRDLGNEGLAIKITPGGETILFDDLLYYDNGQTIKHNLLPSQQHSIQTFQTSEELHFHTKQQHKHYTTTTILEDNVEYTFHFVISHPSFLPS